MQGHDKPVYPDKFIAQAPVRLSLVLRDEDTEKEVAAKIHIYGDNAQDVIKCLKNSVVNLAESLGLRGESDE